MTETYKNRLHDEAIERATYYAQNHAQAEFHAETMRKKARADKQFKAAEDEMKAIEQNLVRAVFHNLPEKHALSFRYAQAKRIFMERLAFLNMTVADLLPRWTCPKCNDTGVLPERQLCDCFSKNKTVCTQGNR